MFSKSNFDSCFCFQGSSEPYSIYLLLYFDDMLLAYHDRSKTDSVKQKPKIEFEMKDLGQSKKILGMEIKKR